MSLFNVAKALTGLVPETPLSRSQTETQRALGAIYDNCDWSFQHGFAGWLTPGIIFNTGSTTTTPYSPSIVCNDYLTNLLLGYTGQPFITQLQYRNPSFSVYNIIAYDDGQDPENSPNYPFATLTLDRPWMEPTSGPGQPYMIYQVYYPAPCLDFRKFIEIRDTTNDGYIDFWSITQATLSVKDPQRLDFSNPRYAVPAGTDQRPGSATLGYQMFELWPHQTNYVPYSYSYRRRGPLPQQPSDWMAMTTPYPITEDMLEQKARQMLLEDAAAKMEAKTPGSGKGMMLLSQMAEKKFMFIFGQVLAIDLNLDGQQQNNVRLRGPWGQGSPYATMNAGINLGGYSGNRSN